MVSKIKYCGTFLSPTGWQVKQATRIFTNQLGVTHRSCIDYLNSNIHITMIEYQVNELGILAHSNLSTKIRIQTKI